MVVRIMVDFLDGPLRKILCSGLLKGGGFERSIVVMYDDTRCRVLVKRLIAPRIAGILLITLVVIGTAKERAPIN